MTCPNCGAPMRLDRERNLMLCTYCRTEAVPPMDEDGVQIVAETAKPCPGCEGTLADGLMEGQAVLYCPRCKGTLIGMDKFLPLIEHLRALRDRPATFFAPRGRHDLERTFRCPLCLGEMSAHPYGGPGNVNIDTCENCAVVWLDRNELRRIVAAPDHQPASSQPLYSRYGDAGEPGQD